MVAPGRAGSMIAVILLSFLKFVAAISLSDRSRGRGEQAIEVWLFWITLVIGPIYALGLANVLTRASLAALSGFIDAGIISLMLVRGRRQGKYRELGWEVLGIIRIPVDLMIESLRSRSLLSILIPFFFFLIGWVCLQAILAPTWKDWDSLWYHEGMTGFTIQNHGFKTVDLPLGLQRVNGFQRLCEMTQTWFAIFAGRKLIDCANLAMLPLTLATMYGFARRHRADVATAAAWGMMLAVVPAHLRLLQSTMVDAEAASLLLCAAYFVSRPELTRRAGVCAGIALTLACGAKVNLIVPAFMLTIWLLIRLIPARKTIGGWWSLGIGIGAGLLEIAMIAFTHLKNWIVFGNPFYPIVNYDNPKWNIHWVGETKVQGDNVLGAIDYNLTFSKMIEFFTARPYTPMPPGPAWQIHDTGFAYVFVIMPLTLGCLLGALGYLVWRLIRRKKEDARDRAEGVALEASALHRRRLVRAAVLLGLIGFLSWVTSPAVFAMRYNIAPVAMMLMGIIWISGLDGFRKIADAIVVLGIVGSLVMAYWATPSWLVSFKTMKAMLSASADKRECSPEFGAPTTLDICLLRESELTAGKVLAFDDTPFIAMFWNSRFTSKAFYLSDLEHPLEQAERLDATWIHARGGQILWRQLQAAPERWQRVGTLEAEPFGDIYRRK